MALANGKVNATGGSEEEDLRMSLADRDTITVVYWTLALHIPLILLSNGLVVATFFLYRALLTPDNVVLVSLALIDMSAGIFYIPCTLTREISSIARSSKAACFFYLSFPEITISSSLSCLVFMAIERAVAINYPFWYANFTSITKVSIGIVIVLLFGIIRLPILMWDVFLYEGEGMIDECSLESATPPFYRSSMLYGKSGIESLLCIALIGQIYFVARGKIKQLSHMTTNKAGKELKEQKAKLKIMTGLMFVFIVLWLPYMGLYITENIEIDQFTKAVLVVVADHCRLFNSSANALIYALSRNTYRIAYKYLLTHNPTKWKELKFHIRKVSTMGPTSFAESQLPASNRASTLASNRASKKQSPAFTPKVQTPVEISIISGTQV